MFVDDEPEALKLFKTLVEPMGYDVVTLVNSQEAAQRIKKEKFDGVFVDALMPQPDGFELTKLIRTSPSNSTTPVVMLTGYDNAETMRKGFQAGITFFLGKPLTPSRLSVLMTTMRGAMLRAKRRYARLPFSTIVTCKRDRQVVKIESFNISEGGMLLAKLAGAAVGQELDLEFLLPKASNPLRPRVKVVRMDLLDRTAVQFVDPKATELEVIRQYISSRVAE